ncbi:ketopantoate reductase family protein [Neorhodopirellula lusitana]|uniref:ketopantoate reductase family protein n=1 Tax=Neorhodopirellula lusitana TaxID=445327 RepID=UPI00384B0DC5
MTPKPIKKISIIGAGAIGATFGGLIKHHHPDVEMVMFARGAHLAAMQAQRHVTLCEAGNEVKIPVKATSDPKDIVGSDLVLFTVKTQDTLKTAELFADILGDAIFVSLQNGINQRVLCKTIRTDRLLVGMTATNMSIVQPGVIDVTRRGISVIGAASPDVPPSIVEQARQTLSLSGLPVESSENILGVQYNKLLFNTMGYASVLSATDFLNDGLLNRNWRTSVALPVLDEGMRVLEAAGITLQKASGGSDVIRWRRLMRLLSTPGLDRIVRAITRGPLSLPKLVFSVYQDLQRNRPTEIDFINGEIVRLANECGVTAPLNAEVVRRIHEMEESTHNSFQSREEIATAFRRLKEAE